MTASRAASTRGASISSIDAVPDPHFVLFADPWSCDAESLVRQLDARLPGQHGDRRPRQRRANARARTRSFSVTAFTATGCVGVALQGDVRVDSDRRAGMPPDRAADVRDADARSPRAGRGRRPAARGRASRPLRARRCARPRAAAVGALPRHRDAPGSVGLRARRLPDPQRRWAPTRGHGCARGRGAAARGHWSCSSTCATRRPPPRTSTRGSRVPAPSAGGSGPPEGALLFSCLGRGAWLYGVPDHDSDAFRRHVGAVPLGGFFCNGEIGPVEQHTFVHGYTSAFALFRPRLA